MVPSSNMLKLRRLRGKGSAPDQPAALGMSESASLEEGSSAHQAGRWSLPLSATRRLLAGEQGLVKMMMQVQCIMCIVTTSRCRF